MLAAYSTAPNYVSHRDPLKGSWFIQALCAIFSEHAHSQSVTRMLEMVQKRVSEEYETSGGKKQGPVSESRLTHALYLFPGVSEE
ncbi:cell death protein CED-3 [Aphelenchoides avenae]|nr:cell death protein CED-3 [Aphelenchus avenae]